MRIINTKAIEEAVYELFLDSCVIPDPKLKVALNKARSRETQPVAQEILDQLMKNIDVAKANRMPLCQDTGMAVVFLDIGQEVHLEGELVTDAVNAGVRHAYKDGYYRKSVLDVLSRQNTTDNTPAIIHTRIVAGDKVHIQVAPKGFGSENMSALKMLTPAEGIDGIRSFVIDTVKNAGGNPCPPITLGIGIGGTFELCALNAKRALLRPLGEPSSDPTIALLERELLAKINHLKIGAMGLGGDTTALAVHIIEHPTHLAGLPVAVNVQCHCVRHGERIL